MSQIVRFTGLKPRTVRATLLVLIQHNLVWHAQNDQEGEVLEFRADECILRLRYGHYVYLASKLFGPTVSHQYVWNRAQLPHIFNKGSDIVSLILDHGKMLPPEVLSCLAKPSSKGKDVS